MNVLLGILKRLAGILLVTCTLFAGQTARLSLLTEPPGCAVQIDTSWIGYAPIRNLVLAPGTHSIRIFAPPSGIWNLQDRQFQITLQPGQDTTISIRFVPLVFINSIPPGAFLMQDTTHVGSTPIYLPFYEYRGKRLVLKKSGYEPFSFVLSDSTPFSVRLTRKAGFVESQRPPLLRIWPRTHTRAKFALLGSTVLTHWLAFYFKNIADEHYNRYLSTADPDLIDRYWKETRKYDRLSDITLAISYTSLAVFIYMVIWH